MKEEKEIERIQDFKMHKKEFLWDKEKCDTKNVKDKLCTKTHVWIEKNNTSLEKEKSREKIIENREKE